MSRGAGTARVTSASSVSLVVFAALVSGLVYALTTFATVEYVDKKHLQVTGDISDVKEDTREIRKMVLEIYKNGIKSH